MTVPGGPAVPPGPGGATVVLSTAHQGSFRREVLANRSYQITLGVLLGLAVVFLVVLPVLAIPLLVVAGLILAAGWWVSRGRQVQGSAWADEWGVHWRSVRGDRDEAWAGIDWIELGASQPGGTIIAALGMNERATTRTGDHVGVTVVSGGLPHVIYPTWTAAHSDLVRFGEQLAAYARARGVRVRVLQGDWGAENVNREPTRLS